jgi:putative hydrolase of the HAD superfamily
MKRALILDLDNTIYPVSSVAEKMFGKLFKLIDEHMTDKQTAAEAKVELTRRPYQQVADEHGFSAELKQQGIDYLKYLTYDQPMQIYPEYEVLKSVKIDKFLVTTGFTKLQFSKVKMLNIESDFKQTYVVDPSLIDQTKKDVFVKIMSENGYAIDEILVIGDDLKSEIKAAVDLGIDTFLFDPENKYPHVNVTYRGKDYHEVIDIIKK